jgi:ribosomal protein L5
MNLLQHFNKEIVPSLKKKLGLKNTNAVPRIEKIVVSIGI